LIRSIQTLTKNEESHYEQSAMGRRKLDQVYGDLASVQVAASQFTPALKSFLHTGHWVDTAYVAERLISTEELLTLARRETPPIPDESTLSRRIQRGRPSAAFCPPGLVWGAEEKQEDLFR